MYTKQAIRELGVTPATLSEAQKRGLEEQARATALEHRGKVLGMPMPEPDDEEGRVYAS